MEAYPVELRERVVKAYEAGEGTLRQVAALFWLGEATVKRWVWLRRDQGGLAPQKKAGGVYSAISAREVDALVGRLGDPTAGEVTAEYNKRRRGRSRVHVSSMKRALHRHGYVVKKNDDGRWRVCARTSSRSARRS